MIHRNQGELERAVSEYDQAIAVNPVHAEAYCHRGNAYKDLDQPKKAIENYKVAMELSPQLREKQKTWGDSSATLILASRLKVLIQTYWVGASPNRARLLDCLANDKAGYGNVRGTEAETWVSIAS